MEPHKNDLQHTQCNHEARTPLSCRCAGSSSPLPLLTLSPCLILSHSRGRRSPNTALKLAIRKTRPNNYWREQQHALSDGIYLLSDGGGVAKGPLERMVATMCLTPQAVAIHCVALRPDARGRELLQYISGMTGESL